MLPTLIGGAPIGGLTQIKSGLDDTTYCQYPSAHLGVDVFSIPRSGLTCIYEEDFHLSQGIVALILVHRVQFTAFVELANSAAIEASVY